MALRRISAATGKSFLLFAMYIPFATISGVQPSLFFASTSAPF